MKVKFVDYEYIDLTFYVVGQIFGEVFSCNFELNHEINVDIFENLL